MGLAALLAVFAAACFGSHEDIEGAAGTLSGDEPEERFMLTLNDYEGGLAAIRAAGGQVRLELPARGLVSVTLPDEAFAALRGNPAVDAIEVDGVRRPMAETMPWGIPRVQADLVGATGDKTVCIIDGGYYLGHEDLPTTGVTGEPAGWDTSECAHGTHVAGTIAAVGGNDLGVVGVNPSGVNIHVVQVFGGADCGWTYSSGLVAALDACVAAGADVINMSLGGASPSSAEESAFNDAFAAGVLSFAAAGNDGNTALSYPASYSSVISVAATAEGDGHASFSQQNAQVEIAAPGKGVLSTVQYEANNFLDVGGVSFAGGAMEGSIEGTASGALADGGTCNTRPARNAYRDQIVLCQRGDATFRDKVDNALRGGAVGVLVYNNEAGSFGGTLGSGRTLNAPVATLSDTQGADALTHLGESATLTVELISPASGYDTYDGTSMATPHAAGVAALVWNARPDASAQQIRTALIASSDDLGDTGRDTFFGHGLVQALDAIAYIDGAPAAATCVPAAGQEVVETSCTGGVDDDCDGATDDADSDCGGGSGGGGSCLPLGASCVSGSECCLGICGGRPGSRTCK